MAGQDDSTGCAIETEQQFWDGQSPRRLYRAATWNLGALLTVRRILELGHVIESDCDTYELIDDALRGWLHLVSTCRDEFLHYEDDVAICSQKLMDSQMFRDNKDYVRTQIIYSLLQEDEFCPLHVIANFLLLDGRSDGATFRQMIDAGCFTRLLDLMKECRERDGRLHRLLLELMYEMSRIDHLRIEDLMHVDDAFVFYLFQLIEAYSDDTLDPYHYPVIRVLVCFPPLGRHELCTDFDVAGSERTVHGCLDHDGGRSVFVLGAPNKSGYQGAQRPRPALQDLWREYNPLTQPRDRDLTAAPHSQAALSPLHNKSDIRILLHQRPPRSSRCHCPQPAGPAKRSHGLEAHVPPRFVSVARTYAAEPAAAL